jgi:kumamolisin
MEEISMALSKKRVPLEGSTRQPMPGARRVGPADRNQQISVTIHLRRRSDPGEFRAAVQQAIAHPMQRLKHLNREEFARIHGADPAGLAKVREFAREHKLTVEKELPAERRVVLKGTVAAMSAAFGNVELSRYDYPQGTYRGRTGEIMLPDDLASYIEAVTGLDNRPVARPHFRWSRNGRGSVMPRAATDGSFTALQVAQLYDFPTNLNGSGQCIGIIELGGGFNVNDLQNYFQNLGLSMPNIQSVSVDGATNQPAPGTDSADSEVDLDIEVVGAVAPGANIVVYFAPGSDDGFLNAVKTAVHDSTNNPSVISISWGGAESVHTQQFMQSMDQTFQDAATMNVTICCAAGDDGSSDLRPPNEPDDGLVHTDFPASSPHALACGGTLLHGSGSSISSEVVWNEGRNGGATGGGVSEIFPLPSWQNGVGVPQSANPSHFQGRGVPDVAGDADPTSGYQIIVDGQQGVIGGTSAVAPLWAGLIALFNQSLGHPVGFLNSTLYGLSQSSGSFHDIVTGNNDISGGGGPYAAGPGWDPATGLGSPDGAKLLSTLSGR